MPRRRGRAQRQPGEPAKRAGRAQGARLLSRRARHRAGQRAFAQRVPPRGEAVLQPRRQVQPADQRRVHRARVRQARRTTRRSASGGSTSSTSPATPRWRRSPSSIRVSRSPTTCRCSRSTANGGSSTRSSTRTGSRPVGVTAAAHSVGRSARRRSRLSFWPLQIAGWAAYFVMVVATFLPMLPPGAGVWPLVRIKIVRTLIGFALTSAAAPRAAAVSGRDVSASPRPSPSRPPCCSASSGACSRASSTAGSDDLGHVVVDWSRAPREALDYALTILAWSALYFGVKWARDLEAARAGALEARALAQQAQLDALRYQLNPHFLFNALNSIRALVDEDALAGEADDHRALRVPALSDARRASRPRCRSARSWRRCATTWRSRRFASRGGCGWRSTSRPRSTDRGAGLLLHPLVENAVKHGMMTQGPLAIGVDARRDEAGLVIRVTNTGTWRDTTRHRRPPLTSGHRRPACATSAPAEPLPGRSRSIVVTRRVSVISHSTRRRERSRRLCRIVFSRVAARRNTQ